MWYLYCYLLLESQKKFISAKQKSHISQGAWIATGIRETGGIIY